MTTHARFLRAIITVAVVLRYCDGFMCPTLFDFYPDPEDCSKFYRCFWGAGFRFDCPTGTLWNHKVLTCDFAYNVDCEKDFWESEADYVDGHMDDHTHNYLFDYGADYSVGVDYIGRDSGGRSHDTGRPRDDSSQWTNDHIWTEKHGESEAMMEKAKDSKPADGNRRFRHRRPAYDTGSPKAVRVTEGKGQRHTTTERMRIEIKPHTVSDTTGTPTTQQSFLDKLLIEHLETLESAEEKPARTGARGSFLDQPKADQSRSANVDYVYFTDKDDKVKNHGRFGYYSFPGKRRSGFYAQPSQRISYLWPFGKRR